MLAANRFLADPTNMACSIAAIQMQLNVTAETAALEYAAATSSVGETTAAQEGRFEVDQEGLANIIAVREEFGGFAGVEAGFNFTAATVPGSGQLIDYSVRDDAIKIIGDFKPIC
jgi:hypothetical protein